MDIIFTDYVRRILLGCVVFANTLAFSFPQADHLTSIGQYYKQNFEYLVVEDRLGSGKRCEASLVSHNYAKYGRLTVLKKLKGENVESYANRVIGVSKILRHDKQFQERFGDIVPKTISPMKGYLLQVKATGVRFSKLKAEQRAFAQLEINAAYEMAKELLDGLLPSKFVGNYSFDPETGKIAAWYDLLTDTKPQPEFTRLLNRDQHLAEIIASYEIIEDLSNGCNGKVYLFNPINQNDEYRILKVYKDPRSARKKAERSNYVANVLRGNARFRARFGEGVIPKTKLGPEKQSLLMTVMNGVNFYSLDDDLKETAQSEFAEAGQIAKSIPELTNYAIDGRQINNGMFDSQTGKLVGWSDHLLHH